MGDNDALMFDYLIQMGAMNPEMEQMKKKQAQVDALRGAKMGMGDTVSGHYVPKGIAGAISTMGQNALGAYGQTKVDAGNAAMNARQAQALEEMRKRMMAGRAGGPTEADVLPYVGQ